MRGIKTMAVVALTLGVAVNAAKHVVVKGDNLWDISGHYLKDPFKWPSIWKINPQVRNPHWIYPREVLRLPGGDDAVTKVVEEKRDGSDPLSGFPLGPDYQKGPELKEDQVLIDMSELAKRHQLDPQTVLLSPSWTTDTSYPDDHHILWKRDGGYAMLMQGRSIHVDIGCDSVKAGDMLEVIETGDRVATIRRHDLDGRLEQIRAYLTVKEVGDSVAYCYVDRVYGDVSMNAKVRRARKVATREITDFQPVAAASSANGKGCVVPDSNYIAKVIANTSNSTLQMPGNYIIVDRGTSAGLQQGDIVEFMDANLPRGIEGSRGYGITVRSGAERATVILNGVTDQPVRLGDKAYVVRRAVAR